MDFHFPFPVLFLLHVCSLLADRAPVDIALWKCATNVSDADLKLIGFIESVDTRSFMQNLSPRSIGAEFAFLTSISSRSLGSSTPISLLTQLVAVSATAGRCIDVADDETCHKNDNQADLTRARYRFSVLLSFVDDSRLEVGSKNQQWSRTISFWARHLAFPAVQPSIDLLAHEFRVLRPRLSIQLLRLRFALKKSKFSPIPSKRVSWCL